jgi:hypothetical protein
MESFESSLPCPTQLKSQSVKASFSGTLLAHFSTYGPAAMEFLGHSNIETTVLYLAADTSDLKKKREVVDQMFAAGD